MRDCASYSSFNISADHRRFFLKLIKVNEGVTNNYCIIYFQSEIEWDIGI